MKRQGSVILVVALIVVIVLVAAGGVWYWKAHNSSVMQPVSQGTESTTPSESVNQATSTEATTSNNAPAVLQPSVAVSAGWGQGRFSFTAPITGCFVFNYPPTFSNPVGDSVSDNDGNTFDYTVAQNVNFPQVEGIYEAEGYTEKGFTTTGGLAGKEFFLKNRTTIFDIFISASQQNFINIDFSHDSRVPSSSLALSTEEAIAQSVIFPCPSQ